MSTPIKLLAAAWLVAVLGMAWWSRTKAIEFARTEQRRIDTLGSGHTPTGPGRLSAMSEIFSAGRDDGDPVALSAVKAANASQEFLRDLRSGLLKEIEAKGHVGAIRACGELATQMREQIDTEQGIAIRRTALRVRNPLNQADAFERGWLESVADGSTDDPTHAYDAEIPAIDGQTAEYRYLAPIYMQTLCLTCHGMPEDIPSEVQAALDEIYPDDQATGFGLGTFRGAISVRIPLFTRESD